MNPNPPPNLEDRLARIPRRGLPEDLRKTCVELARDATAPRPARRTPEPTRRSSPWFSWLWPHPVAWAGLAAVWCTILALHQFAPVPIDVFAAAGPSTPLVPDADSTRQLALQREAREELLRQPLPPPQLDIDRPRNATPPSTNRIA